MIQIADARITGLNFQPVSAVERSIRKVILPKFLPLGNTFAANALSRYPPVLVALLEWVVVTILILLHSPK